MHVSQYNWSAQARKSTSLTKTNGFINQQYYTPTREAPGRPIDAGEIFLGCAFFPCGGSLGVLLPRGAANFGGCCRIEA
jgi:hypothetical protein